MAALQKKAKKDAEHLKAKKAHESRLKECEVAMNAVKDAMKDAMKAECSKLNLAEKESSWRGLHPPFGRGLNERMPLHKEIDVSMCNGFLRIWLGHLLICSYH